MEKPVNQVADNNGARMNGVYEKALAVANKLTVRSALNPALWFAGVITPTCLVGAFSFKDVEFIRNVLVFAAISPVALVAFAYLFFMFFDPDRLHSEEFQLKKFELVKSKNLGEIPQSENLPSVVAPQIEKKEQQ